MDYCGERACSWSSESEAFRIDDLLDFSSEEIGGPIGGKNQDDEGGKNLEAAFSEERNSGDSTVTETEAAAGEVASRLSEERNSAAGVLLPVELCVPTDALEDLDWLSGLINDTFESAPDYAPVETTVFDSAAVTEKALPSVKTWLRGRARTKRRRIGSGASSSSSSSRSVIFVNRFVARAEAAPPVTVPGGKKGKKTKEEGNEEGFFQRRCSHCSVQKTPQWRTGPLGPKTLCNACGVRYKSGRLLPEYRPALSPTFSSDVHSNCHRKVIEIRRQKEEGHQEGMEIVA